MREMILQPYELPVGCGVSLGGSVDAENEFGKIRMVETGNGLFWIAFEPRSSWQSHFWIVSAPGFDYPARWRTRKSPQQLIQIVLKAKRGKELAFARFFHFAAPQNRTVFWSENECDWTSFNEPKVFHSWPRTPFRVLPSVRKRSSPLVYQWLQEQWQKSDSEVRFSWRWTQMSETERLSALYNERDSLPQLLQLMRWVMQSDAKLHASLNSLAESNQPLIWRFNGPYFNENGGFNTGHKLKWEKFLYDFFFPLTPLKMFRPPLCVKDWNSTNQEKPIVRTSPFSYHERLEARQNLRAWLEVNAPDQISKTFILNDILGRAFGRRAGVWNLTAKFSGIRCTRF